MIGAISRASRIHSRKTIGKHNNASIIRLGGKQFLVLLLSFTVFYIFILYGVTVRSHQRRVASNESGLSSFFDQMSQVVNSSLPRNEVHKSDKSISVKGIITNPNVPMEKSKIETSQRKKRMRPNFRPNAHGHMVDPHIVLPTTQHSQSGSDNDLGRTDPHRIVPTDQILTAYIEPIDRSAWDIKPLPVRNVNADDLTTKKYPQLNSCYRLPEQWPTDDYPDDDPFLPWIHDVFPTKDGKYIQFVAQNKQRCHTGTTAEEEAILEHTAPQMALFQHVPLKKIESSDSSPRYRLASHEDADAESISTRFICKFKPSGDVTFSEFNNDYEWVSRRKAAPAMFQRDGRNNKQIHTSQLLFKCPVPDHLVNIVRSGSSVVDDWATIFLDLIPVRTPPRYGPPQEFLSPKYSQSMGEDFQQTFDPQAEWGLDHILPPLENSGRWSNVPVCKPSLMTYEPQALKGPMANKPIKHHLVSCLWASTGYATRGNRYAINDGQRRMLEWITFNKLLGFDHFYIFDNSGAFTNQSSLQPFVDIFPGDVTVINWPSKVCNNNPNNVDSVGERSSQYAAESSCQLRFGPHVNWIGQFDIDEYLVPMGNHTDILGLLKKLDKEGKKIISFPSWRAWPRRTHINNPEDTKYKNKEMCNRLSEPCFELSVREDTTLMEAYNCDRQKPGEKTSVMPAEKQIYRARYVKQHFIHYSTVTETTNMPMDQYYKKFGRRRPFPDPLSRFTDEVNEALMLHSKAIARQDTAGWKRNCHKDGRPIDQCRIGFPWPEDGSNETFNADGWKYNCYVNPRIDNYWAPLLKTKLSEMGFLH